MPRIFCNTPLSVQDRYELPLEAARHVQVLRLQPGSEVTLFNGEGGEYRAEVVEMTRKDVFAHILSFDPIERESKVAVHLAIGIPANERMDWLIEKTTELGLSKLTPLMTQHNVVRVNPERGDKKIQHWNAIAFAACSQCGRNRTPLIDPPITLLNWLKDLPAPQMMSGPRWFFSLDPESEPFGQDLLELKSQPAEKDACVLIAFGPEGGWSAQEEVLLKNHHFRPLSLGTRTLRAETAAIATLASITALFS